MARIRVGNNPESCADLPIRPKFWVVSALNFVIRPKFWAVLAPRYRKVTKIQPRKCE